MSFIKVFMFFNMYFIKNSNRLQIGCYLLKNLLFVFFKLSLIKSDV